MSEKNNETESSSGILSIKTLTTIFKETGITGFLLIVLTFVFLFWSTPEQKQTFIDKFIILETVDESIFPFSFVASFLVLLLIVQSIYCRKMQTIRKQENNRIGKEKSELQAALLDKKLNSSE